MTVKLVVVSHSEKIADGAVELAAQMAPDVLILPAGGTDDGRIGTSLERVMAALEQAADANSDGIGRPDGPGLGGDDSRVRGGVRGGSLAPCCWPMRPSSKGSSPPPWPRRPEQTRRA